MKPKMLKMSPNRFVDNNLQSNGHTLGKPWRNEALVYDDYVFDGYNSVYNLKSISKSVWREQGEAAKKGQTYGLPPRITATPGRPLGCGCDEAFLHGISDVKNGEIEADYLCDHGWHNYEIWQVHEVKKTAPKKQHIKLDKYGQPMTGESFVSGELEEL